MKRCSQCKQEKPTSEYHRQKNSSDGLHGYCKPCNLAVVRRAEIKRRYDLTVEEYEATVALGCAICGEQALGIDHDHENGKNRAALCRKCNLLLGFAGDSPERLHAAADYIESWQRQHQPKEYHT